MIVCIPVTPEGSVAPGWGRADLVAVARVSANVIDAWQEFDVGWGRLHDSGPEGGHHARIAGFLRQHEVEAVVAEHMGPPMEHMLGKMRIKVHLGASGRAREAVLGALNDPRG
jgi:predicted Fe-Mo cluster-binding NifX family protein